MLKQYFFLFLILLSCLKADAQSAPNFTVTDSWGVTHNLYEDYLDQEKTVVLKIFFVACPPCNLIAPHLEPLYQDWGGGQGDVQFIELSIRQNDTNAQVNTYKTTHGTTYPAVGGQGNSVPATTPYTDGTFGPWTGTPTFVVIAPDRSLVYDVYGNNTQGTIAALDAAIASTGAQGLPTAIEPPIQKSVASLISSLVSNELALNVEAHTELMISIISPAGKEMSVARHNSVKGIPVRVDVSSLTEGAWICRIKDSQNRFMASYLFVKI